MHCANLGINDQDCKNLEWKLDLEIYDISELKYKKGTSVKLTS